MYIRMHVHIFHVRTYTHQLLEQVHHVATASISHSQVHFQTIALTLVTKASTDLALAQMLIQMSFLCGNSTSLTTRHYQHTHILRMCTLPTYVCMYIFTYVITCGCTNMCTSPYTHRGVSLYVQYNHKLPVLTT